MYKTERYQCRTTIDDYMENYVDIPCFLGYCKECGKYNKAWSCPPYDFSVEEYWRQFKYIYMIGTKIIFDEETLASVTGQEAVEKVMNEVLTKEKDALSEKLYEVEVQYPGSISLSAGSCSVCETCNRLLDKPCKNPDKLRYSIESLGGNVGKTCSKLMGIELLWCEEGKLPAYFTLVNGFLSNDSNVRIDF